MEPNWLQVATLAASFVAPFVSAKLAVHYALRRFSSEKRWERKAETYASLLEALHHMKNHSEVYMKHELRDSEPSEDQKRELAEIFHRAHSEVRKRADIGNFAISDDAAIALLTLEKDLSESGDVQLGWWGHLQMENDAIDKCLSAIREIAKKDLGFE